MEPCVTLTQSDMEVLFTQWIKDAEDGGWEKNPYDGKMQAEYFFKEAEAYLNAKAEN